MCAFEHVYTYTCVCERMGEGVCVCCSNKQGTFTHGRMYMLACLWVFLDKCVRVLDCANYTNYCA